MSHVCAHIMGIGTHKSFSWLHALIVAILWHVPQWGIVSLHVAPECDVIDPCGGSGACDIRMYASHGRTKLLA